MSRADLSSPRRTRLGVAIIVVLLHVALVLALIRAFAPEFTAAVAERVTAVFSVEITAPPPKPPPDQPDTAGAAGDPGRKAIPRDAAVPKPRIAIARPAPAPPAAGKGDDVRSGASDAGSGSGAGGQGNGTGAGGSGQGAGGAGKAAKIAGDINSARDYPKKGREQRRGDHVVVALTVGTDGRVKGCRAHRPSRDAEADQITCRLATERFRFRPATDAKGNPVESIYGWQQRWYDPRNAQGEKD